MCNSFLVLRVWVSTSQRVLLHERNVWPWFRLPGASTAQRESEGGAHLSSLNPLGQNGQAKWKWAVTIKNIATAAGSPQKSSLSRGRCSRVERSRGLNDSGSMKSIWIYLSTAYRRVTPVARKTGRFCHRVGFAGVAFAACHGGSVLFPSPPIEGMWMNVNEELRKGGKSGLRAISKPTHSTFFFYWPAASYNMRTLHHMVRRKKHDYEGNIWKDSTVLIFKNWIYVSNFFSSRIKVWLTISSE